MRDSENHADAARLVEIIRERSFSQGAEVKLASGRSSNFYFNMKPTMLHPEGATLIGRLVLAKCQALGAEMVGGLEMGAVPIATAVAIASHAGGSPLEAFFVRKEAKAHGTRSLIEGLTSGGTIAGRRVAIVEDVTTTGGSAMKAVEAVREAGAQVVGIVTVVDRQEGAADGFAAAGLRFEPVLMADAFR